MKSEYFEDAPQPITTTVEVEEYELKTPKRITIEYQTTGVFENISDESSGEPGEDIPR